MLSVTWEAGYKAWNPTYSIRGTWHIHGLWPQVKKGTEEDYLYTRELTRDEYNDLDSETKKDISIFWGDFEYLKRQWEKHGIFYTEHPDIRSGTRWLQKTIQLFHGIKHTLENFTEVIEPSMTLTFDVLKLFEKWNSVSERKISIHCSFLWKSDNKYYNGGYFQSPYTFIDEIHFCYDYEWNLINCEPMMSDCTREVVFPSTWNNNVKPDS
ncbi:hypothetical protein B4U80_12492, partial [Leptotrombidium deliense]